MSANTSEHQRIKGKICAGIMKFSTYLQFLHRYLGSDRTRADFVLYLTDLFLKEPSTEKEQEEDENDRYNPLSGSNRTLEKIYSNENGYKLSKTAARKLRSKYDPSKFYEEMVSSLSDSVVSKLIVELRQFGVSAKKNNFEKKCAEMYYAFLDNLSEGKDSIDGTMESSDSLFSGSKNEYKKKNSSISSPEALSFCKRHEKELSLVPLCLVSDNVDVLRHNVRVLYDDYSLCTEETKRAICQLAKTDYIEFKDDWINKCIDLFEKDVKKYNLGNKPFLYDGAKYLHKALELGEARIEYADPFVFCPLFANSKTHSSLTSYIHEYLYHPEDHPDWTEPIDMVWEEMELGSCPLEDMIFWVMRMIISAIYQMPLGEYYDNISIDEDYLDTFEDMYYYTLLVLYSRYGKCLE